MTPKNSDKCPCGCNYPDHWKQRVEPVAEPQSSDLPGDKCKHGIFTSECDECDGPTFEGNDGLASSPSIDAPSCLICGHIRDRAIWHESGVYVCKECVDKVRAPERSIDVAKEARTVGFICAQWKRLDDGCVARCDQEHGHEGRHLDSVIDISWEIEHERIRKGN